MKNIKWPLLAFAIAATLCIMGIGIAIAERSILGAITAIVMLVIIMGRGFITKKKLLKDHS